jgi:hypothetical protein
MRWLLAWAGAALLSIPSAVDGQAFSGVGQMTTNFVELPAGAILVELEHAGDGDFRVRLLDAQGGLVALLTESRGAGEITRAVRIPTAGAYLFDVIASGSWQVRLHTDEAALRRANLAELGRSDGRHAARRRASARWLGFGFAGGLTLGPIGAGGAYLLAGGRSAGDPPAMPADAGRLGSSYREAFAAGYRDAVTGERRTAALVGGIVGAAANAVLVLHFARDGRGMDDDGLPPPPEFYRARIPLVVYTVRVP